MTISVLWLAVVSTLLYGFWAVALDQAMEGLPPATVLASTSAVAFLLATAYAVASSAPLLPSVEGLAPTDGPSAWHWAILAGGLTAAASLLYYSSLAGDETTAATTVTSLYFVVTAVVLASFGIETLSPTDVGAVVASVGAVVLFAV